MNNSNSEKSLKELCDPIQLLLCDVDGTLTDGALFYDFAGNECKSFSVRDGLGLRVWQELGFQFGIVTGKDSSVSKTRAEKLRANVIKMKMLTKGEAIREIIQETGFAREQILFVGDDLNDLGAFQQVGFRVAVGDGAPELRAEADYITQKNGGDGAAREVVEMLLKAKGLWDKAVDFWRG